MTLNDLERQFTALSSELVCSDQRLRLESRSFRYKIALYLRYMYLHIKFDDEIKENPFEGQVYFPIR